MSENESDSSNGQVSNDAKGGSGNTEPGVVTPWSGESVSGDAISRETGLDSSTAERSLDNQALEDLGFDTPNGYVTARGTSEGLVLRIDGRAEWPEIVTDLDKFIEDRADFLRGGQVSIEWLDRLPTRDQRQNLENILVNQCGVKLVSRREKPDVQPTRACVVERGGKTVPLFESRGREANPRDGASKVEPAAAQLGDLTNENGHELAKDILSFTAGETSTAGYLERMEQILGEDVLYEDDSNCKAIFGTLRSGQRVETPFTLLVVGDVNPGADLVAGGDIIVMGRLLGTAHASAYDEHATDKVIVALQMMPIQLRIGSVISRGSGEAGVEAEVARIEDRRIVVQPFKAKMNLGKKLTAVG